MKYGECKKYDGVGYLGGSYKHFTSIHLLCNQSNLIWKFVQMRCTWNCTKVMHTSIRTIFYERQDRVLQNCSQEPPWLKFLSPIISSFLRVLVTQKNMGFFMHSIFHLQNQSYWFVQFVCCSSKWMVGWEKGLIRDYSDRYTNLTCFN